MCIDLVKAIVISLSLFLYIFCEIMDVLGFTVIHAYVMLPLGGELYYKFCHTSRFKKRRLMFIL